MSETGCPDIGLNKFAPQPTPRNTLFSRFYRKESMILPDLKNIPQDIALPVGLLSLNIGYEETIYLQLFRRP